MIEELKITDYKEVLNLWLLAGLKVKERGRDSYDSLQKQIESRNVFLLGYRTNELLVGVVLLSHDSRKGWINRLAVHPDYRGRGIARKLIEKSEVFFESLGLAVYCALIESDNSNSKACFEKVGWSLYEGVVYYTKRLSDES